MIFDIYFLQVKIRIQYSSRILSPCSAHMKPYLLAEAILFSLAVAHSCFNSQSLSLARPFGPFPVGLGACSSVIALVNHTLGSPFISSACTSTMFRPPFSPSSFISLSLFCLPASLMRASASSTRSLLEEAAAHCGSGGG